MQTIINDIIYAFYYILPAYVANAAPVIFGGGYPLDAGKLFWDGKPIFGSNKTVRGFFAGLLVGTFAGFVLSRLYQLSGFPQNSLFQYDAWLGFMLSLGALNGDLLHSFIKRRLDISPGSPLPVADQLDFALGALLFSVVVYPPPWLIAVIIVVVTPPIHLLTNFLAYLIGAKETPW
ncbi:MAG: CDP-2,3-bis-(O-geranylgeranyl)-sn-glycerol synthase [Candidatus Bathyarchaeota archaeon]|nr:CDP-2,3-bis-(O-geranylgeranyl)-sn-glycerol synthase [Candidatus Bathyarchaeota archaeon]